MMELENIIEAIVDDTPDVFTGYVTDEERSRRYIGASNVGQACTQAIAYRMRGFPQDENSPSLKRIFATGHFMEKQVVDRIKWALSLFEGWRIEDTGELEAQRTYKYWGEAARAHSDGVLVSPSGEKILVEIKSANDHSYNRFKKLGVKYANTTYYSQVNMMMGLGEMQRCVFIVINKNNSKIHVEEVEFDEFTYAHIRHRIEMIAGGESERISDDPSSFHCAFCSYKNVCHDLIDLAPDQITCRTCAYGVIEDDGAFATCGLSDKSVTIPMASDESLKNEIARECDRYEDYREI